MKSQLNLLVSLVFLISLAAKSQNNFSCGYIVSANKTAATSTPPPSNCNNFLNDFVPVSADNILEVYVNFYILNASSNVIGPWGNSTSADALAALSQVNSKYADIKPPHLNMGSPVVSNVKVQFKLKNFVTLISPYYSNYVSNPANMDIMGDPNAINVFFGSDPSAPAYAGVTSLATSPYLSNDIWFSSNTYGLNVNAEGDALSHELGHVLGLDEAFFSVIYFSFYRLLY
jgi:hypothetical protein